LAATLSTKTVSSYKRLGRRGELAFLGTEQGKSLQCSDAEPFLHPFLGQHPWIEAQEHALTQPGQIKQAVLKPTCLL